MNEGLRMKATVMVLTYRNLQDLSKTIDSIAIQDYKDIELYISDDGSDNYNEKNVADIAKECQRKNANITNIQINHNQSNMGTVKHINYVVQNCSGEIIIPLSCGDRFYRYNSVSTIVNHFKANENCLIATARRVRVDLNGTEIDIKPTEKRMKLLDEGGTALLESMLFSSFISGASTYYSKRVFEKYGLFDESMYLLEDWPYYLRLLFAGERIYKINDITIFYDTGGVSSGQAVNPLLQKDFIRMFYQVVQPNKDRIPPLLYRRLLCRYYGMEHPGEGIKKMIHALRYPDVIVDKLLHSQKYDAADEL